MARPVSFGILWQARTHLVLLSGLLLLLTLWMFLDPELAHVVEGNLLSGGSLAPATFAGVRSITFFGILITAAVSFTSICATAMIRRKRISLRALLALVAVAGLWFSVLSHAGAVTWQGKRVRLMRQAHALDEIAGHLQKDWPTTDGQRESLGAFMAYPPGRPRTLILLTPPSLHSKDTVISCVERSGDVLRFELSGTEGGVWLESHPASSSPASFLDGLGHNRTLSRYSSLGRNWYLVEYKPA